MKNYSKYNKFGRFNKKTFLKPSIIMVIILVISFIIFLGYALMNDMLTIGGSANTNSYTITYILNGGINSDNPITEYNSTTDGLLPIPTYTGYTFAGWYENDTFTGESLKTTPTRKKGKRFNIIC